MAAIVTGSGLGLYNTSANTLGSATGQPLTGRPGQSDRVYINSATGNLIVQNQDESLAALGLDLSLVRTYNSQGLFSDDNGDNWQLGVHERLYGLLGSVNTTGSAITKVFGDGSEALFIYDAGRGLYVSAAGDGPHDTLSYDSASQSWTYTDGTTTATETYDSTGRLIASSDADGNTRTYGYTGSLLARITDASGQVVYLDYVGSNLSQIRTVSPAGTETRVRYAYDALNRLSQVVVDLSPEDNSIADGKTYVTTYTYDGNSKRIASISNGDGSTVSFTYTQVGSEWRVASYTDGEGRTTLLTYDTINNKTTITDPLGHVTSYVTDVLGRLVTFTDAAGRSTGYSYDADGNVTSITDANGNVTAMEYDARGNLTLSRDAAGNTVTRAYSATNQLLAETVYLVADPDGTGPGLPSQPLTTRYVYDAESHLRFTVSAEGRVTEYRYDYLGNRVAAVQYTGGSYVVGGLLPGDTLTEPQLMLWAFQQDQVKTQRTDYTYDFRGQVSSSTAYAQVDGLGNGVRDGSESVTQVVYDQRGRLLQTIDARGTATADPTDYLTAYTYDGLGRLVTTTQWISSSESRTTLSSYDDANNRYTTTLANGLTTTRVYNRAGELVNVNQTSGANALGTTAYQYDSAGNLRIVNDPTGVRSYAVYDEAGRKVGEIDATGALTETIYDAAGNAVASIRYTNRLSGAQLASLVNADGSPAAASLAAIRPAADAAHDRIVRNVYDRANRPVLVLTQADEDPTRAYVTQRFYDGAGRLTDTIVYAVSVDVATLPANPVPADIEARITANAADRHSRNFYDADGKLRGTLDAEGYLSEYRYDAAGQLVETVNYATATTPALRASGTLDDLRPLADIRDAHGYVLYNSKGQVAGRIDAEGYLTEYQYDAAGNATQEIRYATQGPAYNGTATLATLRPAASASDRIAQTQYDGARQVVSVTRLPDGTVTHFSYDAVGNLIRTDKAWNTAEVRTAQAQYDAQGRVTRELSGEGSAALEALLAQNPAATPAEIDAIWGQYGLSHTYDAAGRRTSTTDANGNKTLFYYDAAGRLTHAINALGEVTETRYDAFGEATDTLRYVNRIDVTGLSGGLVTSDLGARLTTAANAGADSATHVNYTLRGAVKQVIDALGNATAYTYDAFGAVLAKTSPLDAGRSTLTSYAYDRRGLLTQTIEDASNGAYVGLNRTTTKTYDAFGRVVSATDGNGSTSMYGYDRLGRQVTTTDALNQTRSFAYDAFGRTLAVNDALNRTTTYTYDDASRAFTITTPEGVQTTTVSNRHGEIVSVTDGNGNVTTYAYDKNGSLTGTTQADGALNLTSTTAYDHANRKIESVDANGVHTVYAYDAANRLVSRTVDPSGLSLTTTYNYDALGRVVTLTEAAGTPEARVTQSEYDQKGQVRAVVVDPNGLNLRTEYSYDAQGRTLTVTEGAGTADARITEYVYDNLGRRNQEIKDPTGLHLVTAYGYDTNGNVVVKIEGQGTPEARTTRYVYDADNRLTYTVDAAGGVTLKGYDANGNIVRTAQYATPIALAGLGDNLSAADIQARLAPNAGADRVTRYAYDRDNRLVYTADALNYVTEKRYDGNNNVIITLRYAAAIPAGTANTVADIQAAVSLVADPTKDEVVRTVYDAANRAVYSLDALNHVIERTYDGLGKVVSTIAYANPIVLPAFIDAATVAVAVGQVASAGQDRTQRTVYDVAGREFYAIDALGFVKETRYDALGQVTGTIAYHDAISLAGLVANPDPGDIAAALAARVAAQSASDQRTQYEYDKAGRLARTTDAEQRAESYAYDSVGNKIGFTNKKGDTWTYAYDKAGRLIEERTPTVAVTRLVTNADGSVSPVTTQEPVVTRITYDALGNVKTRIEAYGTPEQRTTTYVYDVLGRQIQTIFPPVGVYDAALDNPTNTGPVVTQSANVMNNSWVRNTATNTLASNPGVSIDIRQYKDANGQPLYYADSTPTSVKATLYRSDGTLVGITTTDVGYYSYSVSSYTNYYFWNPVTNWDGKVNISNTDLAPDTYRVELEVRDDVVAAAGPAAYNATYYYDNTDGTWVRTGTVFVNVGTVNNVVTRAETVKSLNTTTQYDAFGDATVNQDTSGNYSYKVYDTLGRVKYEIDAEHYVTEYGYDAFGNQATLTRYATAIDTTAHTNPAAAYTLDEVAGLLARQTTAQHAADRTMSNIYDLLNRAVETKQPEVYSFDSSANQSFTASPTTRNVYDAFGQLIKQSNLKNPLTGEWIDTYFYYNGNGRKTAEINGLGYLTTYQYDAAGNLTAQTEYAQALAYTAPTALTTGTYNATGYLAVATTAATADATSAIGFDRTTRYVYDHLNRKIQEIKVGVQFSNATYGGTLSLAAAQGDLVTRYGYDALGNLVSVTDSSGATTYTYYDALGRSTAVAEPTRLSESSAGSAALPAFGTEQTALGNSYSSGLFLYYKNGKGWEWYGFHQTVNLTWDSLEKWGDGDVTVTATYTRADGTTGTQMRTMSAASAMYGASITWDDIAPGYFWSSIAPYQITSVNHVTVSKVVNGKQAVLIDDAANGHPNLVLFDKPAIASAQVTLKLRPAGATTDWATITASPLLDRGDYYGVDASALTPGGQYEYQLTYQLPNDPTVYFTGTGSITVPDSVASMVDAPRVSASTSSDAAFLPDGYGGGYWGSNSIAGSAGTNTINLKWKSLAGWGPGDTQVTVNYIAANAYGQTTTLSQTQTLSASAGMTGATFTWNTAGGGDPAYTDPTSYQILNSVASITLSKYVNGAWVNVYSQPVANPGPNRLILQGDTNGITGIAIDGIAGDFSATANGGGVLSVDVSALARGTYTYHLIRNGVIETVSRNFEVQSGSVPGPIVVQEIWGYKDDSGGFVRHLEVANLPAGTTALNIEYRRIGDTGPYLSKPATAGATAGVFYLSYVDIANGSYEYRLRDAAGVLLSTAGSSGTFSVKRGAQSVAAQVGTTGGTSIPLTELDHDIFGNVVHQVRYANGTGSAGEYGYSAPAVSTQDQHTYTQYDGFGHAVRTIDGEGKTTYYSYNAAGAVAKQWQLQTNADGVGRYAGKFYDYDRLGHQTATTQVLDAGNLARTEVRYDAFGNIAAKGTNGGWREYYDYDNAGRLWRTNKDDGIAKAYLYNLQGRATAEIRSQGRDLGDRVAYASPQSVDALTTDIERTNTVYDVLGRATAQVQPTWTKESAAAAVAPSLVLQDTNVTSTFTSYQNVYGPFSYGLLYVTTNSINVSWPSLGRLGEGDVTVRIDYTRTDGSKLYLQRTYSSMDAMYGASMYWQDNVPNYGVPPISHLDHITVSKVVDGRSIKVFDQPASGGPVRNLLWRKAAIANSVTTLRIRPTGSATDWTTIIPSTLIDRRDFWAVDIGALATGQYEYQLTYALPDDPNNVYFTGTGTFAVDATPAFVDARTATASASSDVTFIPGTYDGYTWTPDTWSGTNTINLSWNSLATWGPGDVQVTVNYVAANYYGQTATLSTSQTMSAAAGMTGTTISWAASGGDSTSYQILRYVTNVQISKLVNGVWVPVYNRPVASPLADNLVLQGDTTGVTGIAIDGQTGTFNAAALGGGVLAVDVSALARGTYTYHLIRNGITDTTARTFEVQASNVTGPVVVQEIYGYKDASNTTARRLEIANVPTGTSAVTLEYRLVGSNDTYLTKAATATGTAGLFSVSYDDIANGSYEYRLKDTAGNLLTFAGSSGTFNVKRYSDSQSTGATQQTVTPVITQTVDRWGNALTATDPRDAALVTRYRYNYLNQAIEEVKPQAAVWNEGGSSAAQTPTTRYAYDVMGRQIGTVDANNHASGMRYDAAGQAVADYHADGAVARTVYDALGRKAAVLDANGNKTELFYDRNDRLVQQRNALAQSEFYAYDELGNRISVRNGVGDTTRYYYNARGNLTRTRMPLGQDNNYLYDAWGRKIKETHFGTTDTVTWTYDAFGRLTAHTDLGGASYQYAYDHDGHLLTQTNTRGQSLAYSYYANGQLRQVVDQGTATGNLQTAHSIAWYDYDAAGHRTRETCAVVDPAAHGYVDYQEAHIAYDALGRVSAYNDMRASIAYSYDAVGNRRRTQATYQDSTGTKTQDYWYLYDAMNRIVLSQGTLSNGVIGITATQGIQLAYDGANNRRMASYYDGSGNLVTDYYTYDQANRFINTYRVDPATQAVSYTSARSYDAAGRVAEYRVYSSPGVLSSRQLDAYNANGWLTTQTNYDGAGNWTSTIDYSASGAYAYDGRPLSYQIKTPNYTNTYTTTYRAFEAYHEDVVNGGSTYFQSGRTNFTYDVNGNLVKVTDATDSTKTRTFINNAQGEILQKTDWQGKHEYYYYANSQPIGSSGDLTAANFDYNYTPVSDNYPATTPSSYVVNAGDTLQTVALAVYGDAKLWYLIADANGLNGSSTLSAGQSLKIPNVISNIHNDSATFKPYNPGEIIGDTTPNLPDPPPPPDKHHGGGCGIIGMIIMIVVAIVVTIFTAGAALAAIAPEAAAAAAATAGATTTLGAIAAAGTAALTGGVAAGFGLAAFGAAVIGGAVGSIASQLTGMATGNVQEFSWGAVATSALTAGVTAGVGAAFGEAGIAGQIPGNANPSSWGNAVINGMANNAIGQGVNMLTGQQKQFSWANVAAAGIAAGITTSLSPKGASTGAPSSWGQQLEGRIGGAVGGTILSSISAHNGGPSWVNVMADSFGNAIGNAIVDGMKPSPEPPTVEQTMSEFSKFLAGTRASVDAMMESVNGLAGAGPVSTAPDSTGAPTYTLGDDGLLYDQNGNTRKMPVMFADNGQIMNDATGAGVRAAQSAPEDMTDFNAGVEAGTRNGKFAVVNGDPSAGDYGLRFESRGPWSNDPYASWSEVDELPELDVLQNSGVEPDNGPPPRNVVKNITAPPADYTDGVERTPQQTKVFQQAIRDLQDPRVRAFLDTIAKLEGGGAYNLRFDGGAGTVFDDYSAHPSVGVQTPYGKSDAAGRYQFLSSTFNGYARQLGLSDFSPLSQDLAAVADLRHTGAIEPLLKGDVTTAIKLAATEWQAFPGDTKLNLSWKLSEIGWKPMTAPMGKVPALPTRNTFEGVTNIYNANLATQRRY